MYHKELKFTCACFCLNSDTSLYIFREVLKVVKNSNIDIS